MRNRIAKLFPLAFLALLGGAAFLSQVEVQKTDRTMSVQIPKTWDEAALAEWATPIAGLNARPAHSAKVYYALPVENLRTYTVYFPDREPDDYWGRATALIEPERLKAEADWIEAGLVYAPQRTRAIKGHEFGLRLSAQEALS